MARVLDGSANAGAAGFDSGDAVAAVAARFDVSLAWVYRVDATPTRDGLDRAAHRKRSFARRALGAYEEQRLVVLDHGAPGCDPRRVARRAADDGRL